MTLLGDDDEHCWFRALLLRVEGHGAILSPKRPPRMEQCRVLPAPALPAGIPREIAREALAALPIRRYEGDIVLVETRRDFDRAWEDLAGQSAVGWDTETRPAFKVGQSYLPSLVQAATGRAVYLFQLAKMDFSPVIGGLFAEPTIVKPGISVADDLRKLKQVFHFEEASVVDLGTVAKRHGMEQTGLRNLAGIFLGFRVAKGTKTTNWAAVSTPVPGSARRRNSPRVRCPCRSPAKT